MECPRAPIINVVLARISLIISSSSGRTPVQLMLTRLHHRPFSLDAMHQRYRGYSDHSFVAPQPTAFACPSNFKTYLMEMWLLH